MVSGRVVVVDANVLYSIELTDLFLTFASHRLVRVHWSSTILDEVRRNLAKRADLNRLSTDGSGRPVRHLSGPMRHA